MSNKKKIDGIRTGRRKSQKSFARTQAKPHNTTQGSEVVINKEYDHTSNDLKETSQQQSQKKKSSIAKRTKTNKSTNRSLSSKRRPVSIKPRMIITPLVVLASLFSVYSIVNKQHHTTLTVSAHQEQHRVTKSLTAYLEPQAKSLSFSIIAFEDQATMPVLPDTEVEVTERATGMIKVYNSFSTQPQMLAPNTRFESVNGLVYITGDDPTEIPGMVDDVPGEVLVSVTAVEAGEEYNIAPTDFSLPGYRELGLQDRYEKIYGFSLETFENGYRGVEPSVSEAKKDEITALLREDLQTTLVERMNNEKTPELTVVQKSPFFEITDTSFDGLENTLTVNARIYGIIVRTQDLARELAKSTIDIAPDETVTILNDAISVSMETPYAYKGDFNNEVSLLVDQNLAFKWEIDEAGLKEALRGKDYEVISPYLQSTKSVDTIHLKTRPFWKKSFPQEEGAIEIEAI